MLIVEGADFAGKSTLLAKIQSLVLERGWARKFGPLFCRQQRWGRLPATFDYYREYLLATHREQLCDRFTLSELAYGEAYRGGPNIKFTPQARRVVARELNLTGSVQIYVDASWPTTKKRMERRGADEMLTCREQHSKLQAAYQTALNDPALGARGVMTFRLHSTNKKQPYLLDHLNSIVDAWEAYIARSLEVRREIPESYGYLWPKAVLVGERANKRGTRPFAGLDNSSETLGALLDRAGLPERWLYYVNAFNVNSEGVRAEAFHRTLAAPLVIALGKTAGAHLRKINVKHAEFPHPQWIRRFDSRRLEAWAEELRSIVVGVAGAPPVKSFRD